MYRRYDYSSQQVRALASSQQPSRQAIIDHYIYRFLITIDSKSKKYIIVTSLTEIIIHIIYPSAVKTRRTYQGVQRLIIITTTSTDAHDPWHIRTSPPTSHQNGWPMRLRPTTDHPWRLMPPVHSSNPANNQFDKIQARRPAHRLLGCHYMICRRSTIFVAYRPRPVGC